MPPLLFERVTVIDFRTFSLKIDSLKLMIRDLFSVVTLIHSKSIILNSLLPEHIFIRYNEKCQRVPLIFDLSIACFAAAVKLLSKKFRNKYAEKKYLPLDVMQTDFLRLSQTCIALVV